ncbi:MAG: carbon-nitrogen hydrolase family protein [Anaerolineae bacterium]|jgi:predicted amidohydrolase
MAELRVAAVQMDAPVGEVEANLARAQALVEEGAKGGAQLVVLPELFNTGYEYTDRNFDLAEPVDGRTGSWIVDTARRLAVHLLGTFAARFNGKAYITAMLAAPDGRRWFYRKVHVALWENCYFGRGPGAVVADTDLGRIGLLICWDEVFADLARAYQGQVDLLCIPSSPPTYAGTVEDGEGRVLAELPRLRSLGRDLDGVDWFRRAQEIQARSAGVPLVYAARCGEFHSPIPYGLPFLSMLKPGEMVRVLRAVGTGYWLRSTLAGRSCILDGQGARLASTGQEEEAVLLATVETGAPDRATLPAVGKGRSLVPGIPGFQFLFDDIMIALGRRYRRRWK